MGFMRSAFKMVPDPTCIVFLLASFLPEVVAQNHTNITGSAAISDAERVGFEWGSAKRDTSSLHQTCILTMLSCTYHVIHLNIFGPQDTINTGYKRKLKWMLVTLCAPEIICSIALRQWQESRQTVKDMAARDRQIRDRSKTNAVAKVIALVQTGWLICQCVIRAANGLPISQLEIATVAFAACTFVASGFWFHKPLSVASWTPVHYEGALPYSWTPRSKGSLAREAAQRVKMTTRMVKRGCQKSMFFNLVFPFFCFSSIFSVIHLLAWNFNFATPREQLMWRICCLTTTLAPFMIAGSLQLASIWDPAAPGASTQKVAAPEFAALVILCYFTSLLAYFMARLDLMFQIFYCLRSMPVGIYSSSMSWINYIPHA
ncbi:uncharacterized protein LY89DRAFT_672645 [Mollisia scopiformis]|uniref:Uncharacterized protein n=1 Tax=Mollisia scopiformis TaxID=149040 RepID=A0A194WZR2_MOLSC|nr:uncharacterized protein LY89DRAFT_672645 [Mollisia scopiformis]KUJ13431.1 hypothetical protein LY89DRAFT_672645 [Mollisia scopiformis]